MKPFSLLLSSLLLLLGTSINAQLKYNVLFLGNSYTGGNNLPKIIYDVALSAGDTMIYDNHHPGGYQLEDHSLDPVSQGKITLGGWDYVVMQGQSQEPITNSTKFRRAGGVLRGQINASNPCAVPMLYMTWGRKNGDAANCAAFPVMCTYEGMDSTLRNKYLQMGENLNAQVSPVSVVWKYLRQFYPGIELYQADESHPSAAGSYAAACCFYTSLFKKDPTLITFNFGLSTADANIIKNAVKSEVYNNLNKWDYTKLPTSGFKYSIGSGINEVQFSSISLGIHQTYFWDFGDGTTSTSTSPIHAYATNGTYTVTLTTTNCDLQGVHTSSSDTVIQFCSHTPTISTSNPWLCKYDTLWTEPADAYQWLLYGVPLPETKQYLANYYQYGPSSFSVFSTDNGCTELSQTFSESAKWSGYFFDLTQGADPCIGDTVSFAVLHNSGFLNGFETIHWYKNDTLLSLVTNEDTLLITGPGTYRCDVIDPTSNCPLDTTSYTIEFECEVIGIELFNQDVSWRLFPNPAAETITIEFEMKL